MEIKDFQKFRETRASELTWVKSTLQKLFNNSLLRLDPIDKAIKQLRAPCPIDTIPMWGYTIKGLILPVHNLRHLHPQQLKILRLIIDLNFSADAELWDEMVDPFYQYSFSMTLFGELNGQKYSLCWHIDKDDAETSDEFHPLYHIHYSNGKEHITDTSNNEDYDYDWGNTIYLDVPRLMHHPVDLILGIGLCLTNFHSKKIFETLRFEVGFIRAYRIAQDHIMKPYYFNLISQWDKDNRNIKWKTPSKLCPQLV